MNKSEWIKKCQHWKNKWENESFILNDNNLNLYSVVESINKFTTHEDVIMWDAGSPSYVCPVNLRNKGCGHRMIFSPSQADMGWALPASIGVALESKRKVLAIIGDGSFMSNLQELATIKYHKLDITIFVINNNGYLSIENTQRKYYNGRVYGTSKDSGLFFPQLDMIAESFELEYSFIFDKKKLNRYFIDEYKISKKPRIVEVFCKPFEMEVTPSQAMKDGKQAGLHDMYPFLPEEVLNEEMIIK